MSFAFRAYDVSPRGNSINLRLCRSLRIELLMAAGVRKFSVFESKHPTGLGCRGSGGVYLNDLLKERSCHLNRPSAAAFRETQLPRVSSALFDIDVKQNHLRQQSFVVVG